MEGRTPKRSKHTPTKSKKGPEKRGKQDKRDYEKRDENRERSRTDREKRDHEKLSKSGGSKVAPPAKTKGVMTSEENAVDLFPLPDATSALQSRGCCWTLFQRPGQLVCEGLCIREDGTGPPEIPAKYAGCILFDAEKMADCPVPQPV
ncbi:uncharacterized protein LOC144097640 [Amblyomma americanum]